MKDEKKIHVQNFLPHRAPMLMVTDLLSIDENSAKTSFKITEECPFVKDNVLSESGLIENAAQTCTTIVGQSFFDENDVLGNSNQLIGYINAIKKLEIKAYPILASTIETHAKLISRMDMDNFTICTIESNTFYKEETIVHSVMNFLIHEAK